MAPQLTRERMLDMLKTLRVGDGGQMHIEKSIFEELGIPSGMIYEFQRWEAIRILRQRLNI